MRKGPLARGFAALLGWLWAMLPGALPVHAQQEALLDKINAIALVPEDLPPGWSLQEAPAEDASNYDLSALTSMIGTLPETGSIHVAHAVSTPSGTFNVYYFAFARSDGATTADPYFKDAAKKQGWTSFRLGDVILLATTADPQLQEMLAQRKLVPFLETLLAESIAAETAGNLAAAEKGYFAVAQAAPIYAKAWLRLGTIYQRANPPNLGAALEAYQKAVDAQKRSPSLNEEEQWQAMIGLGATTLANGNPDEAIKTLDEARLLGGKLGSEQEAKTDYFIASAYAAKKDEDKLAEYLEAAFEIQKSEGKRDLLERAKSDPTFQDFADKKKFKKLLKKYGKD